MFRGVMPQNPTRPFKVVAMGGSGDGRSVLLNYLVTGAYAEPVGTAGAEFYTL